MLHQGTLGTSHLIMLFYNLESETKSNICFVLYNLDNIMNEIKNHTMLSYTLQSTPCGSNVDYVALSDHTTILTIVSMWSLFPELFGSWTKEMDWF